MRLHSSLNGLIIHAVLIGGALVMIVPYMWMITLSLKPKELTYSKPYLIPTTFVLDNYRQAWQSASFDRYYLNSAIVTAGITKNAKKQDELSALNQLVGSFHVWRR